MGHSLDALSQVIEASQMERLSAQHQLIHRERLDVGVKAHVEELHQALVLRQLELRLPMTSRLLSGGNKISDSPGYCAHHSRRTTSDPSLSLD